MDEQKQKQILEEYAQKWLDIQKDNLLLQLVGFIMDEKHKLEHKIGSGEVQKIFASEEKIEEKIEEEIEEEIENEII
jgi:hypothetical protein